MLDLNLRFQIAALLLMLIVVVDYLRCPKLDLLSGRVFSLLLACTVLNLLFDVATVYTVTHLETVPAWLNRLCHQLFIGTIDTAIYLLYLYVMILGRSATRIRPLRFTLISLPYLASLGMVLFGQLYYYKDATGAYSYGPMATTIYVSVLFYILLIHSHLMMHKGLFLAKTRLAIIVGTGIWIAAAIVQFFFPKLLLSGLALALMIAYIYITFENPKEHVDRQTGCFNRRALHLALNERLGSPKPIFIVNLVMDDLARVTDEAGYLAATALVGLVGQEMRQRLCLRVYHYRWNSLVLLAPYPEAELRERLAPAMERFDHRWKLDGRKLYLRAHADILECPRFANTPDTAYDLLDFQYGQNIIDAPPHLRFASEVIVEKHNRRVAVEKLLDQALTDDGLEVVYQPIYSAPRKAFVSAEALVRLKDTQTIGFVPPDEFIPIAEQKGVIAELGETVLEKVCSFATQNKLWELGIEYVEVNLSGVQIVDMELPGQITSILAKHGVKPSFINFEITESAAVQSDRQLQENMRALREMGCSFSMDDFGTGYSNLSQIARTSYDLVKLDKSLIWPCFGEDARQPSIILRNIVSMIGELRTHLVAEGVETQEQAEALVEMGVTYLQGYLYSRPLREADLLAFLKANA